MRCLRVGLTVAALLGMYTMPAKGQVYVQWYPVERTDYQAPAPNQMPAPMSYGPTVNTSTTVSTRWEPAEPTMVAAGEYPAVNYAPTPAPAPAPAYAYPSAGTAYPAPAPYVPTPAYPAPAPYVPAPAYATQVSYVPPTPYTTVMNYAPATPYVPVAQYAAPSVSYMPVVARYPAPTYVTYAPVAQRYPAPAPAPVGPKVWVHPKVYVEGQPIRNLIRAVTP
jgi:hypothetical protein